MSVGDRFGKLRGKRHPRAIGIATVLVITSLGATGCSSDLTAPPVPEHTALSSAAAEQIYTQEADSAWAIVTAKFPAAARPEARRIRSTTVADRAEVLAQCMREAGYASKADAEGGVVTEGIPASQQEAFAVAEYTCGVKYPFEAELNRPLDESQIKWLYYYYVSKLKPCLEGEGYSVPQPPSESSFIESYHSGTGIWDPSSVLMNEDQKTIDKVTELCPQAPDGLYPQ